MPDYDAETAKAYQDGKSIARMARLRALYEFVEKDFKGRPFCNDMLIAILHQAYLNEQNPSVEIDMKDILAFQDGSLAMQYVKGEIHDWTQKD